MATYKANYQSFLEEAMSAGGTPAAMEACVKEYNTIEQGERAATPGFLKWVVVNVFMCSACGKAFKLDEKDAPKPDDEPRCPACPCP